MTLKLRNAFLRGWFAARSRRAPPAPDGMAEKAYLDQGFDACANSAGSALPLLSPVDAAALRDAWDLRMELERMRLQNQRYFAGTYPHRSPAAVDLDLREAAAAGQAAPDATNTVGPERQTPARREDDEAPRENHFLQTRGYGPSWVGGRVRYKG